MESLQYPIGKFVRLDHYDQATIRSSQQDIEALPDQLEHQCHSLTPVQWQTPYRHGGWTLRQVIHHVADSHAQAFLRFKWALTEHHPVIKPYHQDTWATLSDNETDPLDSLLIIKGVHRRWVVLMKYMQEEDWLKGYFHPEQGRIVSLGEAVCLYAWHSKHHLSHLKLVAEHNKS